MRSPRGDNSSLFQALGYWGRAKNIVASKEKNKQAKTIAD